MAWTASLILEFLAVIVALPPSIRALIGLYNLLRPRFVGSGSEPQEMLPVASQDMSRPQRRHFLLLESISLARYIEAWIARIYQAASVFSLVLSYIVHLRSFVSTALSASHFYG